MKAGVGKYQEFVDLDPENGDKKTREELILEYAPLVKTIVERIALPLPPHISKDELISGGIMGETYRILKPLLKKAKAKNRTAKFKNIFFSFLSV